MKVICDSQLAVEVKPGSKVNMPVWAYSFEMSTTDGRADPPAGS